MNIKVNPMLFRKQFELFKIPEYYTYYIDYDRLSFYLDKSEKSKCKKNYKKWPKSQLLILLLYHFYLKSHEMFIIEGKKLQGIYYLSTQNEVFELDLVNKLEHAIIEVDAEKAIQSVDFLINLPELSQKSKNNFSYF